MINTLLAWIMNITVTLNEHHLKLLATKLFFFFQQLVEVDNNEEIKSPY